MSVTLSLHAHTPYALPEGESGRNISGRFQREPFASGDVKIVFGRVISPSPPRSAG